MMSSMMYVTIYKQEYIANTLAIITCQSSYQELMSCYILFTPCMGNLNLFWSGTVRSVCCTDFNSRAGVNTSLANSAKLFTGEQ